MFSFRPLSILASRITHFFGWTIDTTSLAQPLVSPPDFESKKKEATETFAHISLSVQSNILNTYKPPAYVPTSEFPKLKG
jgi:hypothetical protein